jgi:alpha-tubulin suppressor-like RCC1 family protein
MKTNFTPLWGGLLLLFGVGSASAQTVANTFAASTNHSVSIRPDGSLWAWGLNYDGQLGNGTTDCSSAPVQVAAADAPGAQWAQVAAGTAHTLALTTDGRLYAWGSNSDGQLGDGTKTAHLRPVAVRFPASATGATWKQVAAGTSHSLALAADGRLYAWGNNNHGELGNGSSTDRATPVEVALPHSAANTTWAYVAAGNHHTLALTANGHLYAWGGNDYGQLGNGTEMTALLPTPIGLTKKLAGLRWNHVAAGRFHTLAVASNGQLYTWGSNRFGQLGEDHDAKHSLPEPMRLAPALATIAWKQVAAGDAHSLALSADGRVMAWGNNCAGQLGDGSTERQLKPVEVVALSGATPGAWARVVSGGFHTLATTKDGQFYAWGANKHGQVGDGTTADRNRPLAQDPLLTSVSQVAAEKSAAPAKRTAFPVEEWGLNDDRLMNELPESPSFLIRLEPKNEAPY